MSKPGNDIVNTNSQTSTANQSSGKPNSQPLGYANAIKTKPPVPLRTSSAPPEDHQSNSGAPKSLFVPTKTGSLISTSEGSTTLNFRSAVTKKDTEKSEAIQETTDSSNNLVNSTMSQPESTAEKAPVAETAAPAADNSSAPAPSTNTTGNEYRSYDNNRPRNNNQRNRSGSGNFQGNYGGRGGNRQSNMSAPQMSTPVTAQYQQGYYASSYYPNYQQQQQMNLDPEAMNYYTGMFYSLFNQYKQTGCDDSLATYYAQSQASSYLAAFNQSRSFNQQQPYVQQQGANMFVPDAQQMMAGAPQMQYQQQQVHQPQHMVPAQQQPQQPQYEKPVAAAPAVSYSAVSASQGQAATPQQQQVPQSAVQAATTETTSHAEPVAAVAPSTPTPTPTVVTRTARKLTIKKKLDNGQIEEVDLSTLKAEKQASTAAAAAAAAAAATSAQPAATEKLSVDTNVHAQTTDGPASWEATPVMPGAPPALQKSAANAVPSSSSRPNSRVYTRQQIMDLKPATFEQIPMYTTGITSSGEATPDGRRGGGFREGGKGGNQGGRNNNGEFRNENGGNRGNRGNREGDDWQKERLSPKNPPTKPNIPFKKDIKDDPLAALEQEATEIINKITPETFDKLSKKTLELKVTNTVMLDSLVKLIFEAAVTQAGFSGVFADLCNFLTESATEWNFYTVVKKAENDEYFWVKNVSFPEEYAGPFYEKSAIAEAVASGVAMKAMPGQNLSSVEVLLIDNHLVRMGKNMSDAFLITYLPYDTVPEENRSQNVFPDEATAKKDAATQVSFRACLAQNCEREFHASVQDENLYDGVDEELRQLRANRATMGDSEFERKEQDIEEKRIKIKRRMLGNIKFVGELYKRKLLNTETMHYCITKLIGTADSVHDEQDLELLLHLLTTLGETLENKSRKSKNKQLAVQFDQYFERLEILRKDTTLPSRIRFAIDDLVKLRERKWQGKKQAEGPMKISELHNKLSEDQKAAAPGNSGKNTGKSNAPGTKPTGRGGPQDVRNASGKNAPASGRGGAPAGNNKGGFAGKGPQDTRDNAKKPAAAAPAGGRNERAAPAAAAAAAPAEPEVYDFTNKTLKSKAHTCVEEYLSGVSVSEVILDLKEQSCTFHGQLILEILDLLMNFSDANKLKKLYELVGNAEVLAEITRGREAVKQALESHEGFKNLVDTIVDVKEAPERIAAVVAELVRGNVLTESWVGELIDRFHAYNIEQDYNQPADIDAAFDRFKSTLSSEIKK